MNKKLRYLITIQLPQLYTKSPNSETSNNDINNDEICYLKVSLSSKISTQLHIGTNTRALSGYLVRGLLLASKGNRMWEPFL